MKGNSAVLSQSAVFGKFLYFFAFYTVLIKYLFPVAWAFLQKTPLTQYIYFWDAWWIAHLAVGFHLVRGTRGIWLWALLLAALEIAIIATKFVLYFQHPVINFWYLNWFINKSLLVVYFGILLIWLLRNDVQEVLRGKRKA